MLGRHQEGNVTNGYQTHRTSHIQTQGFSWWYEYDEWCFLADFFQVLLILMGIYVKAEEPVQAVDSWQSLEWRVFLSLLRSFGASKTFSICFEKTVVVYIKWADTQCWKRKVNNGGNKPYVQSAADQNEDNWNIKCDQNTALYLQVWNQSLPSYSVLPNLHHCPAQPQAFQVMVAIDDLLPICTAPIQAFFCNLFSILLLLQPSHQNFSPVVDYSTPEILQCLLLSLHFSLSSPNDICPFILIWADIPPAMHMHAHFWLTPRAVLAFCILFKSLVFIF